MMSENRLGEEVLALLSAERSGTLSTLSKKLDGWPFGSVVQYTLSDGGEPVILISEIAEHTRNLRHDARVSLMVWDSRSLDDPQAGARATLIGHAIPVSAPYREETKRRYLEKFPNAAGYFAMHDFTLFLLKTARIRYIGGFGEIHWLDWKDMAIIPSSSVDPIAPHVAGICDHMNEDHSDALILYAAAFSGIQADSARMVHVDSQGFDMIAVCEGVHRHVRLDFPSPVSQPDEVRAAMVDMVRRARQRPTAML
ncbi:MAG TPA: DUF2470 domain-containing protein [Blastocatellia bacterium]|nr:DUF2470 domain-containing protein [Blastocatellia bacterium]